MTLAQVEAFESLNTSHISEVDDRWLVVYRALFPYEYPIPSPCMYNLAHQNFEGL